MTPTVADVLVLAVLLTVCVFAWSVVLRRSVRGEAVVPYEPRRPVPWDAVTIWTAGVVFITISSVVILASQFLLRRDDAMRAALDRTAGTPELWTVPGYATAAFQAGVISNVLVTALVITLLVVRSRADAEDLGLTLRRLGYDLRLGSFSLFVIAAPALVLQAVLTQLVEPSQHPIFLALKNGSDRTTIVWATIAAVVVAPPVEEFLYRGVLQGWLEKVIVGVGLRSFLPIVMSALIFAAMHYGNGVDVVPLFFLALGLGYLYRQTHRLWPGMVVHTLLNAFSMTVAIFGASVS